MTVGLNNHFALDLAAHLKTASVRVDKLRKGDILITEHNVICLMGVTVNDDGSIELKEVDDNNTIYPKHLVRSKVTILDRDILKGRRPR